MALNPSSFQEKFIQELEKRLTKKGELVESLMTLLSLTKDGAYRRLRGDTALTAEELQVLALQFDISLDVLFKTDQPKVLFSYNLFNDPIHSLSDYLHQVLTQVSSFSQLKEVEVYYSSREIPVFLFMMFPKLLSFKLYLFGITAWDIESLRDRKFTFDLLHTEDFKIAKQISETYCKVDSIDIWPLSVLNQTLNQIEYLLVEGRFENISIAVELCEEIFKLLQHTRQMAEKGQKFLPGSTPEEITNNGKFELFYNEIASTDNNILCISENQYALFNTFTSPNFLFTTDQKICLAIENWFKQILNHSTSISIYSGKSRAYFFNLLEKRATELRQHISTINKERA